LDHNTHTNNDSENDVNANANAAIYLGCGDYGTWDYDNVSLCAGTQRPLYGDYVFAMIRCAILAIASNQPWQSTMTASARYICGIQSLHRAGTRIKAKTYIVSSAVVMENALALFGADFIIDQDLNVAILLNKAESSPSDTGDDRIRKRDVIETVGCSSQAKSPPCWNMSSMKCKKHNHQSCRSHYPGAQGDWELVYDTEEMQFHYDVPPAPPPPSKRWPCQPSYTYMEIVFTVLSYNRAAVLGTGQTQTRSAWSQLQY
jgi:hypothetical protein